VKNLIEIYIIILLLLLSGCQSTTEISTYRELVAEKEDGDIEIVTTDTSVYFVDRFSFSDSTINIMGTKKKGEFETSFRGSLNFSDISYIQSTNTNIFGGLLYIGATGFIAGYGLPIMTGSPGLDAAVRIVYPRGTSPSCPFIYSWNGNGYILEGEAFGTGLGKLLETRTSIVMKSLESLDGKIRVKLTNERPETHFLNNVKMISVETKPWETVYSDNRNNICAISTHKKISKAIDQSGSEVTNLLKENDDNYWRSDLSSANSEAEYEDNINIFINDVARADSFSLVVSGKNTNLTTVVFLYLQKLLGDEYVNFHKAADVDPELSELIKSALVRSALKIDVWDGNEWKYTDLIFPEANKTKFTKLVRLPLYDRDTDEVKIRLRCLTDVWEIDGVIYDDSPPPKFDLNYPLLTRYESNAENELHTLLDKDDKYAKLLPCQEILLEYEEVLIPKKKKITYVMTVSGYLYEFVIDSGPVTVTKLEDVNLTSLKMRFAKELFRNIDLSLPAIYGKWISIRDKIALNEF
jgi:hypothetical protein